MVYEVSNRRRSEISGKKRPGWFANFSLYFTEYCNNSTIHGLKFLGERRRNLVEKYGIWWLLFISLSLYFCVNLILSTYSKWLRSPVIVSFATSETAIWQIPFPAITICPLIKTDLNKFNFKALSPDNYTTTNGIKLEYISVLCPKVLTIFEKINSADTVEDFAIQFLIDTMPDFDQTIFKCMWCNDDCNNISNPAFVPTLTSGAVCYSFNMLNWSDIYTDNVNLEYYRNVSIVYRSSSTWSVEDGYSNKADMGAYPRKTLSLGTKGGLEVYLYSLVQDVSYNCGDSLKGYKVMIHNPGEIPRFNEQYFWVPLDELVTVAVKPDMKTTSADLKNYAPEKRKCYFQDEKSLSFFRIYNQQNCALECLTNYTYGTCGCIGYHMPRTNDTPICGPAKLECLEKAEVNFNVREVTVQTSSSGNGLPSERLKDCNCLPSCHSLYYDTEISQLSWDWREMNILNKDAYDNDNSTTHLSRLRIFFKDMQFLTSERNELYGQTELWANCGGLLGLFTGFSFISFIEILYYATLRFACNVRKYGWNRWSGAEELLELKVEH